MTVVNTKEFVFQFRGKDMWNDYIKRPYSDSEEVWNTQTKLLSFLNMNSDGTTEYRLVIREQRTTEMVVT